MTLLWTFLKRDTFINMSYRASFAFQILTIFTSVPLVYFIGKLVGGSEIDALTVYGGDYFAFLLVGVALIDYLSVSLTVFTVNIRESQMMGTLEIVLLSPTTVGQLLIYSSAWIYAFTTIRFMIYVGLGFVFGLRLEDANYGGAILILVLGIVCFASIGILAASLIMVIKRGETITGAIAYVSLALGGIVFPTSVMPGWLAGLAKLLPITHTSEGLRKALLSGATTAELGGQLIVLAVFVVVLVPAAFLSFSAAVRHAKAAGTLAQY